MSYSCFDWLFLWQSITFHPTPPTPHPQKKRIKTLTMQNQKIKINIKTKVLNPTKGKKNICLEGRGLGEILYRGRSRKIVKDSALYWEQTFQIGPVLLSQQAHPWVFCRPVVQTWVLIQVTGLEFSHCRTVQVTLYLINQRSPMSNENNQVTTTMVESSHARYRYLSLGVPSDHLQQGPFVTHFLFRLAYIRC